MKIKLTFKFVILILFGILLVLVASVLLYVNAHLGDLLKEQIDLHTKDDLKISFKDVSVNALSQSAEIEQFRISKLDSSTTAWCVDVQSIGIENLSVLTLFRGEGVKLDSVHLSGVDVIFHKNSEKEEPDSLSPHNEIKRNTLPVKIAGIRVSAGTFDYDPEGPARASGSFSFSLNDFQRDSSSIIDLKSTYLNTGFNIHLDRLVSADSLYSFSIQSIKKTRGDTIFIDSLALSPTRSLSSFSKHFGWNKAMLSAEVGAITTKIDLSNFPDSIEIPYSLVENLSLLIEKDNRWPLPDRVTSLPQELLSGLPIKFRLDSMAVQNAETKINLVQENGETASLSVTNVQASLGAQNLDYTLPALELNSTHMVMGEAQSSLSTTYRYGDHSPFELSIFVENTEFAFMSAFLKKAIGIKIVEGTLNRFKLDMTGNEFSSRGKVIFEYEDLKIAAVDKETGKEKKALNVLANVLGSLVFWKENPAHNDYRTGNFEIERDVRKAFISQWFDGLEAGIVNVVAKIDPLKTQTPKKTKRKR